MPPLVALALILILVIFFVVVLRIARGMARGAICTVIGTFRMYGAIRPQDALTLRELGLANPRIFEFLRDYRPWAIQTLFQAGIIKPSPIGASIFPKKRSITPQVSSATRIWG